MTTIFVMMAEFFKTGLFAIGGGLATLPFLNEMAEKYPWFSKAELSDMIAISESTPGPIGVNMATYAGFNAYGVLGGILATLSLVAPSIIVIILISKILDRFKENPIVEDLFYGLRPAVAALIAFAAWELFDIAMIRDTFTALWQILDWRAFCIFIILTVLNFKFEKIHPILFIIAGAVIGIAFQMA